MSKVKRTVPIVWIRMSEENAVCENQNRVTSVTDDYPDDKNQISFTVKQRITESHSILCLAIQKWMSERCK